jgi:hypothetical protein
MFPVEVVARPSATFLRLVALAPRGLPAPGAYTGCIETSGSWAPCAVRVLDDLSTVWCQPRAALPFAAPGQGARVTVFADLGSGR